MAYSTVHPMQRIMISVLTAMKTTVCMRLGGNGVGWWRSVRRGVSGGARCLIG